MAPVHDREGFEALIKPITDISKIEIDLCKSLEEYMSHIHSVEVNPGTFAEAALLVQNSAAIYSKKVDFLWTIVIQLLEALRRSKPTCSSCGGSDCSSPCQRKNRRNRQNESTNSEDAGEAANPAVGKKRNIKATAAAIQEFQSIENICSDHNLDEKVKKAAKKEETKIVLNAAIKVKTDHNVTCTIYDSSGEIMGKKDEFRLHWKMSSSGVLHEHFVNTHCKNRRKEGGYIEDSICEMDVDTDAPAAIDDDFPACNDDFPGHDESLFPTPPENTEDVALSECIAENEFEAGAQRVATRKEHIVNVENIRKKAWEPVAFDASMPEKVARKRNIMKVPEAIQPKTGKENLKRKRKINELEISVNSYLTIDGLVEKHLRADQLNKYLNEYELLRTIQAEKKLKRQVLQMRRKAYQELLIQEASKEFVGEFEGFPDMDPDSDDDEGGGFNGFVENAGDFIGDDVNIPLPEEGNHLHNDDYDIEKDLPDVNTYETEALKTLQEYQMRKIQEEEKRMLGLSDRVAAWHQLIKPRLEEAERIRHFDIHEYGSRILNKFPVCSSTPKDNIKFFAEIVAGLPSGEVARHFLATLCLANTNNVELTKTNPDKMAMDCLQLKLLSRTRHHEEMHDNIIQNHKS